MVCVKGGCEWNNQGVCGRPCRCAVDDVRAGLKPVPPVPCDSCPAEKQFHCNGAICSQYRRWVAISMQRLRGAFGIEDLHIAD